MSEFEEQYIKLFLSSRRKKDSRNSDKILRRIATYSGSGGGLFSKGSRRSFVRNSAASYRQVIVKALIVKNSGSDWIDRRHKHVQYLLRDGAGKDSEKAVAYSSKTDDLNAEKFVYDGIDDPHEFRFIVSAQDAGEIDLTEFTRKLMGTIEKDVGTNLEWMAVNHYNTDNHHTHIILRGIDSEGQKLILERDYISNGIRNRAREIVTRELGEKSRQEIEKEISLSVGKKRATGFDYLFEKNVDQERKYAIQSGFKINGIEVGCELQEKRLEVLKKFGLSEKMDDGYWKLKPNLIPSLKKMGIQGDIIKMMHAETKASEQNCIVYDRNIHGQSDIRGEVVKRGLVDELSDKEFIVVKTNENKFYYVNLDKYSEKDRIEVGSLADVTTTKARIILKKSDENIDSFAKKNDGVYDEKAHALWANSMNIKHLDYVQKHVDRISQLEKLGLATKCGEGRWKVSPDLIQKLNYMDAESKEKHVPRVSVQKIEPEPKRKVEVKR